MELIDRLLVAFPFTGREIRLLIQTAPRRYKTHLIEKRNGRGKRLIAQPTAELKAVQRWLVATYFQNLPVHASAMAYRPGLGIKNHAEIHATNKYLLKLDFKDFFPSIRAVDFKAHLERYLGAVSADERTAIARLLFREEPASGSLILSIGAPSSPALSNTILYAFDLAVAEYCSALDVRYTRYADDLAFSTSRPRMLEKIEKFVIDTCEKMEYPRLTLNAEKTVYTSKKFQRQLTGLILANDGKVSIGREKKRQIRSMMHRFAQGKLSNEEVGKLRGLIAFVMSVDRPYVETLRRMVGNTTFDSL